ncbi:MAG: hypothetical protein ACRD0S_09380, partial [Acidimicrobiales bacterium]
MSTDGEYRLPRRVDPEHYQLTFTVRLDEGTFAGEERVRVVVHEPTGEVVLNAVDLAIHEAELTGDDGAVHAGTVELDEEAERATIRLPVTVPPGPYALHLTFSGRLGEKLHGVYRSTWTDEQGVEHAIAATQF